MKDPNLQTSKPKVKEPMAKMKESKAKVKESNLQTDISTGAAAEGSKPQTRASSNVPKKPKVSPESSVQKKSKD